MPDCLGHIAAVLVGKAVAYTRKGTLSAIAKEARAGPIAVHAEGLEGDEHGDPKVHGGLDKAIHHYPFDHYAAWRDDLGELTLLDRPGAFGENLSTSGISERDICLGDRLCVGSVMLEVSQARQPCWKLNDRFGVPDMARRVQDTLRAGWYYRVLETGTIAAGDPLVLVERPFPDWPVSRLLELLYRRRLDREWLKEAVALPLPPSWRRTFEGRLSRGVVEDWTTRLGGPPGQG